MDYLTEALKFMDRATDAQEAAKKQAHYDMAREMLKKAIEERDSRSAPSPS